MLEDTAEDAELVEMALRQAGISFIAHRVETRDGFLRALETFAPDIVLSDYRLPSFDGRTALDLVLEHRPEVPVIMVTGAMGDEMAVDLLKAGARDYVLKDRLARLPSAVMRALTEERESHGRQAAEKALRESEEMFRTMSASAQDAIILIGDDGRVSFWNAAAEAIFGYAQAEVQGRDLCACIVPAACHAAFVAGLARFRISGEGQMVGKTTELLARRKDGGEFPVEVSISAVRSAGRWNAIAIVRDISDRKRAEEKLRQAQRAFDHTTEGIMVTDARVNLVAVNKAFTTITGYAESDALGKNPRMLASGRQDANFYRNMWASIRQTGVWSGEIWNRRRDGEVFPEWLTISAVEDSDGRVSHYVGVFRDITSAKRSQEALDFLAHHDSLTELPNRLLCKSRLEHALQRARRKDAQLAVLFVDLDRFKSVNDSLGHPVGDELLRTVARYMAGRLRGDDTLARMGGDEFVILLEHEVSAHGIAAVARKIIDLFAMPVRVDHHELFITASVGISLYPADGEDADTLLRNADLAMYQAKAQGRNNFQFYAPTLTLAANERLQLDNALRRALDQGELRLAYQPQVDMSTGELVGVEALARWNHAEMGAVPPDRFIPVAEEIGLIAKLGQWALHEACCQVATWRREGLQVPHVAVNLSMRQLEDESLVSMVAEVLALNGLRPESLELELTESAIMRQTDQALAAMEGLRQLGVRLSVDDFGTGYSSLSYLKQLPLHRLKIDRSFVHDLTKDANDEAIARAIIRLGQSLGLEVVAEGVETEDRCSWLLREGCRIGQGYFYGRALPPGEIYKQYGARDCRASFWQDR